MTILVNKERNIYVSPLNMSIERIMMIEHRQRDIYADKKWINYNNIIAVGLAKDAPVYFMIDILESGISKPKHINVNKRKWFRNYCTGGKIIKTDHIYLHKNKDNSMQSGRDITIKHSWESLLIALNHPKNIIVYYEK